MPLVILNRKPKPSTSPLDNHLIMPSLNGRKASSAHVEKLDSTHCAGGAWSHPVPQANIRLQKAFAAEESGVPGAGKMPGHILRVHKRIKGGFPGG